MSNWAKWGVIGIVGFVIIIVLAVMNQNIAGVGQQDRDAADELREQMD